VPGRGSNRSSATANVTLYCTWRPSGLTIVLHGQGKESSTRTPSVEAHRPAVTYLQFPIQVCFPWLEACVGHAQPDRPTSVTDGLNSSIDFSAEIESEIGGKLVPATWRKSRPNRYK